MSMRCVAGVTTVFDSVSVGVRPESDVHQTLYAPWDRPNEWLISTAITIVAMRAP